MAELWGLDYTVRQSELETQAASELAQLGDATRQARLRATLQQQAAYDIIFEEANRFKGPAPHQNQSTNAWRVGLDREAVCKCHHQARSV